MQDVTFIIKTFERPYCVERLVKSIFRYYPTAKVLIGDDSEVSCKKLFEREHRVTVYELPYDCGVSFGRNYLVDRVETQYLVVLDDDFVFDKKTNITKAVEVLKEKDIDILGGYIRNYSLVKNQFTKLKVMLYTLIKREKPTNYIGTLNMDYNNKILYADYITKKFPEYILSDIVLQFFVARTNVLKDIVRWDDELKTQEHTPFFLSAKEKGVKVAFSSCMSVQHKPIKLQKYSTFRNRDFNLLFMEKYGIDKIVKTYNGGKKEIVERPQGNV